MLVPISALYAVLLGIVTLALQLLVGRERLRTGVSIYDGGDERLAVAIRRHANFCEHVPFVLLLLALIELNGGSVWILHGLGAWLVLARIVHPLGLEYHDSQRIARFLGAFSTLLITAIACGVAAWQLLGA